VTGRVNFGDMTRRKKLIWRLSALEQIVSKLREDVDTLKQHKMATIVKGTNNKNTNPQKGTKNKHKNPKMRVSLRHVIFKSEVLRYIIIRMFIEIVCKIME
jgi:hypothetical protein